MKLSLPRPRRSRNLLSLDRLILFCFLAALACKTIEALTLQTSRWATCSFQGGSTKNWKQLHNGCETKNPITRCFGSPCDDQFDVQSLQRRLMDMKVTMMEQEFRKPPNPSLSPYDLVLEILKGLWNNSDPLPDSGFRRLLRASTKRWRNKVYEAVGASIPRETYGTKNGEEENVNQDIVATALGQAMGRPHNQFAILVGEAERYVVNFPSDPVNYYDGTCWIECRLRDKMDDSLLVVTGWQLQQRKSDGAWLVDNIDWQDFRDEFRPGIGREEWIRMCG